MSELRELYQEVILDHNRRPRNFRELEGAGRVAKGHNPLCGDKVTVFLDVEDDRVKDVTFQGVGCAISTASASLMTEMVKGLSPREAKVLFEKFHALVTSDTSHPVDTDEHFADLGKLLALAGVREFPVRVKCATLPWHTMRAALDQHDDLVTTE